MLLDYEFWPSVHWMVSFYKEETVLLEKWGTYQKQSNFNRCYVLGVNGRLTLSVPLIGGRKQKSLIQDIKIDYGQRWIVQQLRTLQSCYGKAPFFDYYFPMIEELLSLQPTYMLQLNQAILQKLIQWLKWGSHFSETESFQPKEKLIANNFTPGSYLQVFSDKYPFVGNLSILDALFCLGPQTKDYLRQQTAI